MTIKIQAYQSKGVKTDKVEDEFEFCCWENLHQWLHGFAELHKCPKCKKLPLTSQGLDKDVYKELGNKLEKEGELHIQKGDKTVHFYKFREGSKNEQ